MTSASQGSAGADPGPADSQTERPADDAVDHAAFTERGEEAETAAFLDEGAYSGGEFAGGHLPEQG